MITDLKKICNKKTFESIFNTYAKDLKRFIFFKSQDIDLAEDILQEAFINLWKNCSNVQYSKVKSYLFTTANNMFLNVKKHEKVVHTYQKRYKHEHVNESPEFILLEKEFLEKLERTIASLPEKQRDVFLLNRIEKKKYREIAILLNISVKTVEKRMHSALLIMRKEIGNI